MNIVLLGPPGSGKGTQIKEMSGYLDFEVIATGEIAREMAKKDNKIQQSLDRGELIGDDVLIKEIDRLLDKMPEGKNIVFDGFPRNLAQAGELEKMMLEHGRTIDLAIYISLDEQDVVNRLAIRKICSNCGNPIFSGETCPNCGGKAIARPDDKAQTVINRMQVFLDRTTPLIEYYNNKSILYEINGNQTVENVAKDIKEKLISERR